MSERGVCICPECGLQFSDEGKRDLETLVARYHEAASPRTRIEVYSLAVRAGLHRRTDSPFAVPALEPIEGSRRFSFRFIRKPRRPTGAVYEALHAAEYISECGEHPEHLLNAERKARAALATLQRERGGSIEDAVERLASVARRARARADIRP